MGTDMPYDWHFFDEEIQKQHNLIKDCTTCEYSNADRRKGENIRCIRFSQWVSPSFHCGEFKLPTIARWEEIFPVEIQPKPDLRGDMRAIL